MHDLLETQKQKVKILDTSGKAGADLSARQSVSRWLPGCRLPLSGRSADTFPNPQHHRPFSSTKLYCLIHKRIRISFNYCERQFIAIIMSSQKPVMHRRIGVYCSLQVSLNHVMLWLKSIGVKFKVRVRDQDSGWFNGDDNVDQHVQLLQLTPALDASVANWTTIVMHGLRRRRKTR